MVALLTSVRNSPCFGGLRRTKTCHRQLFARPSMLFGYFLHDAKSNNPFPFREVRGFANLESAHPNNNFPLTKLNPFETFRGFPNLDSARRNGGFAQTKLNPFAALRPIRRFAATIVLLFVKHKSRTKSLCPIRGSTLRVQKASFREFRDFTNLHAAHLSAPHGSRRFLVVLFEYDQKAFGSGIVQRLGNL